MVFENKNFSQQRKSDVVKPSVEMDAEFTAIPLKIKEEILELGKDRSKKDVYLFRYCFLNTYKDIDDFFVKNSFHNMTPEYSQFIDQSFSKTMNHI